LVVKSGGMCSKGITTKGGQGIIPMLTRPLTFCQIQIFTPKVINI
jgi:hypothetical protein